MGKFIGVVRRIRKWIHGGRRVDTLLNVTLAAGLLLAIGSVGWVVTVPGSGNSFTELSLLTENETGAFVADDYPARITRGEATPLVVAIGNHEHRPMNYTVVVELQRVATNDATTVRAERELHRFTLRVDANVTRRTQLSIVPSLTGSHLRLAFLLYDGSAPAEPTIETADREVHLWVNVTAPR
jgi:uncharacterized membrane protein